MGDMLQDKNIAVGISSSIACYKMIDIIKELKKLGANVDVIMTRNTTKLVDPKDIEKACGKKAAIDMFNPNVDYRYYLKKDKKIEHISLADKADLFLIAPATANIIGKFANGIADNLLTATVLSTRSKVIVCPSMNVNMWKNTIVQENVAKLKRHGFNFIDPEYGMLACGCKGVGRLANKERIINEIIKSLTSNLKNKKILITAGATIENIDPVRHISNKSSGKMGIALADEAHKRGAIVTLLQAKTDVNPAQNYKTIKVSSVDELHKQIQKEISSHDTMIHCAAASDFTVDKRNTKIRSNKKIRLELEPTTKILNQIKRLNKDIFLIGFKAEYNVSEKELIDRAYKSLLSSGSDIIIANDIGTVPFGSDDNECTVVKKDKEPRKIPRSDKTTIANKILDELG